MTNNNIDKILLGDNSFIGVDHLSQERVREKISRLNTERIIEIIDTALESGATGLVCATHPIMYDVITDMKKQGYKRQFGYYLILPYAQGYVQAATEKGIMGLVTEIFQKLGWAGALSSFAKGGLSAITFNPHKLLKSAIDIEVGGFLKIKPENAMLRGIFLHEVFTDLVLSFRRDDIFRLYIEHIEKKYHTKAGFVTRNFARFVKTFEEFNLPLDKIIIMTPFNKAGFQMTPSESACRETLGQLKNTQVIAMSTMAAGYLKLEESFEYISTLPNPPAVVIGTSRKEHALSTFSTASRMLVG